MTQTAYTLQQDLAQVRAAHDHDKRVIEIYRERVSVMLAALLAIEEIVTSKRCAQGTMESIKLNAIADVRNIAIGAIDRAGVN